MPDDDFKPKLGRSRSKDAKRAVKYGGRILAAARLAGAKTGVRSRRFDGSRIGRGASMGRLLSSRDRLAGFRGRRAVVKASLIRLQGKAGQAARAHMRYIQRDGVTREGLPGELYGSETDTIQFSRRLCEDVSALTSAICIVHAYHNLSEIYIMNLTNQFAICQNRVYMLLTKELACADPASISKVPYWTEWSPEACLQSGRRRTFSTLVLATPSIRCSID